MNASKYEISNTFIQQDPIGQRTSIDQTKTSCVVAFHIRYQSAGEEAKRKTTSHSSTPTSLHTPPITRDDDDVEDREETQATSRIIVRKEHNLPKQGKRRTPRGPHGGGGGKCDGSRGKAVPYRKEGEKPWSQLCPKGRFSGPPNAVPRYGFSYGDTFPHEQHENGHPVTGAHEFFPRSVVATHRFSMESFCWLLLLLRPCSGGGEKKALAHAQSPKHNFYLCRSLPRS